MIRPLDHLTQHGNPDDSAILLRDRNVNFGAFEQMVGRLAAWLAQHDFPPGTRIASWLPKGLISLILPLGVVRAGHVYVPVNPLLKHAQLRHILADAEAAMLISQPARLSGLVADDVPSGCLLVSDVDVTAVIQDETADHMGPSSADASALCEILYTSGSTGRPKGVMLSHANLMIGARSVATYLHLGPGDRTLAVLPLSFDYGQNQLFSSWWAGAGVAPLDYLAAKDVVKGCERWGITTLAGVPPLWVQLIDAAWPEAVLMQMRRLTNSGGALSRALVERLRSLFPTTDIYAMYGLTEAFRSTYLPPELLATHPTSMGQAIPDAEILIVRADGSITDNGEPGELVHCGPLVAQGYWRDSARTAERFRPAPPASLYSGVSVWSGDTVMRDADGLLHFVGRDDAMIKSAGNRISPTEIEEAALAIEGVVEALAFGRSDDRLGQAIILVVRKASDAGDGLAERLSTGLRSALPNFMQPAELHIVDDLPRNPNGKLDRTAIISQIMEKPA